MTKKEVVAKEEHQLVGTQQDGAWGSENIDSEDIIVPRIMLMQAMSELVSDGHASLGQYIDSLNKDRVIAEKDKTFDVIVFGSDKKIMVNKNNEFEGFEDYTPDYVYEEVDAGGNVVNRNLLTQFYVLLVSDIEAGEAFPYVLSFTKTSTKEGKKLATLIKKLSMFKKPSAAKVFTIGSKQESNDKGKWFVPTVAMGRDSTSEEMSQAYDFYKALMQTNNFKVDDSDIKKEETETTEVQDSKEDMSQSTLRV